MCELLTCAVSCNFSPMLTIWSACTLVIILSCWFCKHNFLCSSLNYCWYLYHYCYSLRLLSPNNVMLVTSSCNDQYHNISASMTWVISSVFTIFTNISYLSNSLIKQQKLKACSIITPMSLFVTVSHWLQMYHWLMVLNPQQTSHCVLLCFLRAHS